MTSVGNIINNPSQTPPQVFAIITERRNIAGKVTSCEKPVNVVLSPNYFFHLQLCEINSFYVYSLNNTLGST